MWVVHMGLFILQTHMYLKSISHFGVKWNFFPGFLWSVNELYVCSALHGRLIQQTKPGILFKKKTREMHIYRPADLCVISVLCFSYCPSSPPFSTFLSGCYLSIGFQSHCAFVMMCRPCMSLLVKSHLLLLNFIWFDRQTWNVL